MPALPATPAEAATVRALIDAASVLAWTTIGPLALMSAPVNLASTTLAMSLNAMLIPTAPAMLAPGPAVTPMPTPPASATMSLVSIALTVKEPSSISTSPSTVARVCFATAFWVAAPAPPKDPLPVVAEAAPAIASADVLELDSAAIR